MKNSCFAKILDKTVIESSENLQVTIDRLRMQQGPCRDLDNRDFLLDFICTKKGKIHIDDAGSRHLNNYSRIYSVRGEVFSEDGKAKVAIYTVYNRLAALYRASTIIDLVLILAVSILGVCLTDLPLIATIGGPLLLGGVVIVSFLMRAAKEHQQRDSDTEIMKNEIIRRVEAIKRWDD